MHVFPIRPESIEMGIVSAQTLVVALICLAAYACLIAFGIAATRAAFQLMKSLVRSFSIRRRARQIKKAREAYGTSAQAPAAETIPEPWS